MSTPRNRSRRASQIPIRQGLGHLVDERRRHAASEELPEIPQHEGAQHLLLHVSILSFAWFCWPLPRCRLCHRCNARKAARSASVPDKGLSTRGTTTPLGVTGRITPLSTRCHVQPRGSGVGLSVVSVRLAVSPKGGRSIRVLFRRTLVSGFVGRSEGFNVRFRRTLGRFSALNCRNGHTLASDGFGRSISQRTFGSNLRLGGSPVISHRKHVSRYSLALRSIARRLKLPILTSSRKPACSSSRNRLPAVSLLQGESREPPR